MALYDLAQPDQVVLYLTNTPFASETATRLTGGSGNYVYRLKLHNKYHGRSTFVLKHAKPYLPGARDFAIAVERQLFEVTATISVAAWLPEDSKVGVATVHHFDTENHVIIMDDCGETVVDLKKLMKDNPLDPNLGSQIGRALGEFLGRLHTWGKKHQSLLQFFDANKQGRQLSAYITYGRLVSTITGEDDMLNLPLSNGPTPSLYVSPKDIQKMSDIVKERMAEIMTSRETMTMGDFWTGNILVDITDGKLEKITVVDWELAKPGIAALDVGQFYAEVALLGSFHPPCREAASRMCRSFFQEYEKAYPVDSSLVQKMGIHAGAHLVVWTPRMAWGGEEETAEVMKRGIRYILEADKLAKLEDIIDI